MEDNIDIKCVNLHRGKIYLVFLICDNEINNENKYLIDVFQYELREAQ